VELRECLVAWLGRISYEEALSLQMQICDLKKQGFDKDVLLLLEHPPTITLGRSGKRDHLLVTEEYLKLRGIDLWNVDRGGDITFHGPGQLVGYPILTLQTQERDVHRYMHNLEESLIQLLETYGINGSREHGLTGVWTQAGKIAAMGVHISRWITRHGFALNINTDLSYYDFIVPCGISGRKITSLQYILSHSVNMEEVVERYLPIFGTLWDRAMIPYDDANLREEFRRFSCKHGNENKTDTNPEMN
jgi:lipoyl(octanoyl) transferase